MAILYGTQSNGETLPVLVDQFGNLIAKGIEGQPGPPGPPGVGELPPGAFDGAYLGWENGELVWFGSPIPPVVLAGFRPVVYTGNGTSQSITGVGFSPDLVWIKIRTAANSHALFDIVRGPNLRLKSDNTAAESQSNGSLTSFDADGFSVGNNPSVNEDSANLIAWCWNAGDTTVTVPASAGGPDVECKVRANTDTGFSIVKVDAPTSTTARAHGLGKVPDLIIAKSTASSDQWHTWWSALGATYFINLNSDAAASGPGADQFGTGLHTDELFYVKPNTASGANKSGGMIYYLWAETPGVSSFGKYDGGSRQQIRTGFRPSFVMIKSQGVGNWFMFDNARGVQQTLRANLPDVEDQTGVVEFLDDGFQLLFALPGVNESNVSYIYAAFANPEDAAYAQRQLRRQARQEERQQNETQPR